jgi:hypothetical protein
MKALSMAIAILFLITACSKDDYCDVKSDLLGSWKYIEDEGYQLTFNNDNTMSGTYNYDIGLYYYGFTSLDTIAFFQDISGLKNEYAFEIRNNGDELIIKKFRTRDIGTERYNYVFNRLD